MDQAVIDRLKELEDANGRLTVDAVIEDAKDENSPLHQHFDWDDAVAAHNWRKEQARRLIRYKLLVREEHTVARRVTYVPDPDMPDGGYVSTARLKTDKDRSRTALIAELNRADSAMARAYEVAHALGLSGEVEQIRNQIRGVRDVA